MPSSEQTLNWDKEKWIEGLCQSFYRQTQIGVIVRIKKKRSFTFVQYKGTDILPPSTKQRYRRVGKITYSTRAALPWAIGRKIKFEKHETSLFVLTSESAKSVIKTADDPIS